MMPLTTDHLRDTIGIEMNDGELEEGRNILMTTPLLTEHNSSTGIEMNSSSSYSRDAVKEGFISNKNLKLDTHMYMDSKEVSKSI
jgi:hypothetical protein